MFCIFCMGELVMYVLYGELVLYVLHVLYWGVGSVWGS